MISKEKIKYMVGEKIHFILVKSALLQSQKFIEP